MVMYRNTYLIAPMFHINMSLFLCEILFQDFCTSYNIYTNHYFISLLPYQTIVPYIYILFKSFIPVYHDFGLKLIYTFLVFVPPKMSCIVSGGMSVVKLYTIPFLESFVEFRFSAEKSIRNGLLSDVHQQGRADSSTRGQSAWRFQPGSVYTGQRAVEYRVYQRQSRVS